MTQQTYETYDVTDATEEEPTLRRTPALVPPTETRPHAHRVVRTVAYGGLLAAIPAGVGFGVATATGSRRGGALASAAAVLGMVAVRWQLQRWFTDEPRHLVEDSVGGLEIRSYAPRIEARTTIETESFDEALDQGFDRLFRYLRGHNSTRETLAMTVPVTAARSDGGHVVSFVLPPHHELSSLPRPRDMRVSLEEVPAQRVASLRFRGRYDGETVARLESEMVRHVLEGGLDTTGEPIFAGYDPPTTLGLLRRNEIWMVLV